MTADVSLGSDADRVAAVDTDLNVIGYDDRRGDRFLCDALERVRSMPGVEGGGAGFARPSRPVVDAAGRPGPRRPRLGRPGRLDV